MGSFILRTPFNRSVPLARRARIYQSILFARRKTGKAKNDAMPPKVRMVAPDGKQVFEPSHHGHPWAKKWANLQPLYQTGLVMWQEVPGRPAGRIILAHGAPLPFAEVGSPAVPGLPVLVRVLQPMLFCR